MKSVSIVIPNWNDKDLLLENLPSVIKASEYKKNNIIEIIVVDDKSTDDSLEILSSRFKDKVKIIKHTKNRGFSASVNTGARSSKGDYLVLLNSDVSPSQDFLVSMFSLFNKDEKLFAVSMSEKGYGYSIANFKNGYIELTSAKHISKPAQTFYVSGGSAIYDKSKWKELGGLDERLLSPYYWEDLDICYRARKRGYYCLWNPESKVLYNHESSVSKLNKTKVNLIRERNQLLVIWKNILSKRMLNRHIVALLKRLVAHPGYIKPIIMALFKFPILLRSRRIEIKESTVSDEAVFSSFD